MDYETLDINTLIILASQKYLTAQSISFNDNAAVNDLLYQALVAYLNAA